MVGTLHLRARPWMVDRPAGPLAALLSKTIARFSRESGDPGFPPADHTDGAVNWEALGARLFSRAQAAQ